MIYAQTKDPESLGLMHPLQTVGLVQSIAATFSIESLKLIEKRLLKNYVLLLLK